MTHIYNEAAYEAGKKRNIKNNAFKTNSKNWLAAAEDHKELYDWLNHTGLYADIYVAKDSVLKPNFDYEYFNLPVGYKSADHDFEIIEIDGKKNIRHFILTNHPLTEKMFEGDFGHFLRKLAHILTGNYFFEDDKGKEIPSWGKLTEKQTEVVRNALKRAKANLEKKSEREAGWAAEAAKREYVGEVGEKKFKVEGTIAFRTSWEGEWGVTFMTVIRDANDNTIKYKGKPIGLKGEKVSFTATIKAHEEYKGEKQTIVNRPKFAKV
jgi:hypothetical protein|tara:strand:+ start:4824 stop:5621 length:798 start_codon:yes stop_codon:yes gene_type:complete